MSALVDSLAALLLGVIIFILHALFGAHGAGRFKWRRTPVTFGGVDLEDLMQDLRLLRWLKRAHARTPSQGQVERTLSSRLARRTALEERASALLQERTGAQSPEEVVGARQLLEVLAQRLDPRVMEQFALRSRGLTFREIAEEFSESEDAVRKRLARASTEMRDLIKN